MFTTEENTVHAQGWSRWTASLGLHLAIVTALLTIHSGAPSLMERRQSESIMPLVYEPIRQTRPVPLPVVITHAPIVMRHTLPTPVTVKHVPVVIPPDRVTEAKPVAIAAPEPVLLAALPAAAPDRVQLKTTDLPSRPPAPVKTGVFGDPGQAPNGHVPAARLEVQTGGFGGPGATPAAGHGNSAGPVRTGGFGDASGSGPGSPGNSRPGVIAEAGFGNANAQGVPVHRIESAAAPAETPVEVLWKPKPVYTSEARAKKLEGNVTLEVVFRASGDVHVIRVVRGLGSGLDESARTAAEQIRFRPGKKDGVAVDRTGLVTITFELS